MEVGRDLTAFVAKKIFITGHMGFKGSWLSYWLHSLGAIIKGFSLPVDTEPNLFSALGTAGEIESVTANINNAARLQTEMLLFQPDYVFHLAAQPLVRRSYSDPLDTFQTNVIGTANVLEALRHLEKPCVCICITTDKVYQNKEWVYPYRENDRLGGYDPYSASKACAEMVISSFTNSYFHLNNYPDHQKGIASVRAGNVIGGGDWSEDRLIPDIVKALSKDEEIFIRNPSAVRPWQHVMEPLLGYMQLALAVSKDVRRFSGSWNFGPPAEDNLSVLDLSNLAVGIWGSGNFRLTENENAPHEANLLRLDVSKAMNELKWMPKLPTSLAVERTIKWYKEFYAGKEATALIKEDIEFYQTL